VQYRTRLGKADSAGDNDTQITAATPLRGPRRQHRAAADGDGDGAGVHCGRRVSPGVGAHWGGPGGAGAVRVVLDELPARRAGEEGEEVMRHRTLDVSHLPNYGWDEQSPLWWGNLLLTLVESTTLLIMFTSYFYLRMNFQQWPPPKVDVIPPIGHPVPDLGAATADVALMLIACFPMYWTDMAA